MPPRSHYHSRLLSLETLSLLNYDPVQPAVISGYTHSLISISSHVSLIPNGSCCLPPPLLHREVQLSAFIIHSFMCVLLWLFLSHCIYSFYVWAHTHVSTKHMGMAEDSLWESLHSIVCIPKNQTQGPPAWWPAHLPTEPCGWASVAGSPRSATLQHG